MREFRSLISTYQKEMTRAFEKTKEKTADHDRWGFYNEHLQSFENDFARVIPPGYGGVKHYIEYKFAKRSGEVRGVELGGVGSNLFEGFSRGFFRDTRGVSLYDGREEYNKLMDKQINHNVITGDMLDENTVEEVKKWLGKDQKVDVIIERMIGGHNCLPNEPFLMGQKINDWYPLLSDDGILLAEIPHAFSRPLRDKHYSPYYKENLMPAWKRMIDEEYEGKLRVRRYGPALFIEKLTGAPEHLPLLPARFVLEEEKKMFKKIQ